MRELRVSSDRSDGEPAGSGDPSREDAVCGLSRRDVRAQRLEDASVLAGGVCQLKPNVPLPPGSRGSCPLAAGGASSRNRGRQRASPFGGTSPGALRTHRSLYIPGGLVRGAGGHGVRAWTHRAFDGVRPGQSLRRAKGRCPLDPHRCASWTPVSVAAFTDARISSNCRCHVPATASSPQIRPLPINRRPILVPVQRQQNTRRRRPRFPRIT